MSCNIYFIFLNKLIGWCKHWNCHRRGSTGRPLVSVHDTSDSPVGSWLPRESTLLSCLNHGRWSWPRSSWWRDFLGWRDLWLQICSVLIVIVSANFFYIYALLVPRLPSDVSSYGLQSCVPSLQCWLCRSFYTGEQQTAVRGRQQLLSKRHWKFSELLTVVLRF